MGRKATPRGDPMGPQGRTEMLSDTTLRTAAMARSLRIAAISLPRTGITQHDLPIEATRVRRVAATRRLRIEDTPAEAGRMEARLPTMEAQAMEVAGAPMVAAEGLVVADLAEVAALPAVAVTLVEADTPEAEAMAGGRAFQICISGTPSEVDGVFPCESFFNSFRDSIGTPGLPHTGPIFDMKGNRCSPF